MSITATALEMRLAIRRLQRQHFSEPEPCNIPLADPTPHSMILEGAAATTDIDLDRTKLRGWAFGFPLPRRCRDVPLLYRHDPDQPAGRIVDLYYDEHGALQIRAHVDHPIAKRCGAWSISARVIAYTMHDVESPNFYAVINQAELTEISLTSTPANPGAVVTRRYRASPQVAFYEQMSEKVKCLSAITQLIRQEMNP